MNHFTHKLAMPNWEDGVDVFIWGDEQEGSEAYRADAFAAFKADWKRSKNPYAIGIGDYRDFMRPSMGERIDSVLVRDKSLKKQLDDLVRPGVEKTAARLEFMKGRILGMHEGHHDYEFSSGMNGTQMLAEALKTTNLGWMASHRLSIDFPEKNNTDDKNRSYSVTGATSHGNASGRNTTSVAQSMEQSMKDLVCNFKVQGHACRSASWSPHPYRTVRRNGPPGVNTLVCEHLLVGGFCDSYTDGWISKPIEEGVGERRKQIGGRPASGYAERRNLTPQVVSWGIIRVHFRANLAQAREIGVSDRTRLLDIEAIRRCPTLAEDGRYY